MCYQVVERYSVCRCLYYKHAIDPCGALGQLNHTVQEKTVLVGYACSLHSGHRPGTVISQHTDPSIEDEYGLYAPFQLR